MSVCELMKITHGVDAETIRVTFNEDKVSYQNVLDMFFGFHTPGNPKWTGTQYRSAIFVHTPEQREMAENTVKSLGALGSFVAVEDASDFYKAEEYHQKYIEKYTT
jgi:methionine-S-sulfoxide reductase